MTQFTDLSSYDLCVVGSGFFGSVIAERAATQLNRKVLVLERRPHIGGNCYSETDAETGIEVHRYGSHIFHTSDEKVWRYMNTFTAFNEYRHRVFTTCRGKVYSLPINLATINNFFDKNLPPHDARKFVEDQAASAGLSQPKNFEEKAISMIGKPLYDAFIKGYSEKQWNTPLHALPASIITRLPVRFNFNDRYFDDRFEGIPIGGYTKIFERMLTHPCIEVKLNVDFFELRRVLPRELLVVYTGPIDRFYDYKHGRLGWRTVHFNKQIVPREDFQGTAVMNYADADVPYTRIHEFRHYHPERNYRKDSTVIFEEFSQSAQGSDEPYYPINTAEDARIFKLYRDEMAEEENVVFGGRLAQYKYLDMHQVIGAALVTFEREIVPRFSEQKLTAALVENRS